MDLAADQAADPSGVSATLRLMAGAGPFFTLDVGPREPGWHPAGALRTPGDELAGAIEAVRQWASGTRPRVAASLFFMSYTGRLLSATVAGMLLGGVLVDVGAHSWRYVPGVGVQLRLPAATGWRVLPDQLETAFGERVADGLLAPTIAAIRSTVPVAAGLLWGNAASSAVGALQGLAAAGIVPAERCRAFGDALLELPALRGTGGFVGPSLAFRRRSCCLFYVLPNAGMCADCPLPRR